MKQYLIPIEVFVALSAAAYVLWRYIHPAAPDLLPILVGLTLLLAAAISFVVFQYLHVREDAALMASAMAKREMLYSRELFTELYRNSPVPYVLIDKRGVIESTNFSAVRLFKTEMGELNGMNIFERISGENENHIATFPEKFRGGIFIDREEVSVRCVDDSVRWVLLSIFSFIDPQGVKKGLVTLVDVTKQKQIDQAKTEFVSLASHQLRTPIAAMKWNLELFTMQAEVPMTEKQQMYLRKVERNLKRMDALVNDFLNVSRLELGTFSVNLEAVDLLEFLKDIYEEHRQKAETKKVTVGVEYGDDVHVIRSDPRLLTMIVGNLLSNAVKYTPSGGHVDIRCGKKDGTFEIEVADNGIGVPEEEQDRLFTKIFRASNAEAEESEGTGLGLYVVKQAAEALGGTVGFESTEGVGTTFTVRLPEA